MYRLCQDRHIYINTTEPGGLEGLIATSRSFAHSDCQIHMANIADHPVKLSVLTEYFSYRDSLRINNVPLDGRSPEFLLTNITASVNETRWNFFNRMVLIKFSGMSKYDFCKTLLTYRYVHVRTVTLAKHVSQMSTQLKHWSTPSNGCWISIQIFWMMLLTIRVYDGVVTYWRHEKITSKFLSTIFLWGYI